MLTKLKALKKLCAKVLDIKETEVKGSTMAGVLEELAEGYQLPDVQEVHGSDGAAGVGIESGTAAIEGRTVTITFQKTDGESFDVAFDLPVEEETEE